MPELTEKQKAELQEIYHAMDGAAGDAENELSELRTSPELDIGINAVEDWMLRWVPKAGYKRLGKILFTNGKENKDKEK